MIIAAFPKSNTESDAKELEALPAQILQSEGGFPHYEEYIGKPNPVDACTCRYFIQTFLEPVDISEIILSHIFIY